MLALSKLIFIRKQQQKMDIYSFNDCVSPPLPPPMEKPIKDYRLPAAMFLATETQHREGDFFIL